MTQLVLLSMALALIIVPLWAAGDPSARRGLKKTVVGVLAFGVLYLFLVRFVVPYLG